MSPSDAETPLAALLNGADVDDEVLRDVRVRILALDAPLRPAWFRRVAACVSYRNQRDNAGRLVPGDCMCNVTAIAMALNQLGLGVEEGQGEQFEDLLDQQGVGDGRYRLDGQRCIVRRFASRFGVDVKVERVESHFEGAEGARTWFDEVVRPRLEGGEASTMGRVICPDGATHIVRLEWVEFEGLVVDDPFGALYREPDGSYAYRSNDTRTAEGPGAQGEDNRWPWDMVADLNRRNRTYVQFYRRMDQG